MKKNNFTLQQIEISQQLIDSLCMRELQVALDAQVLRFLVDLVPEENVRFNTFTRESALACEIVCATICHQINWDFLRSRLFSSVSNNQHLFDCSRLREFDDSFIRKLLEGYSHPERIREKERAALIRDLAIIFSNGIESFEDIFFIGNTVRNDFIRILKQSHVFAADPQEKKLHVLLHNLSNLQLVPDIQDFCKPAIDYHIMRLYLRRGDVSASKSFGKRYIEENKTRRFQTVSAVRKHVADALQYMAFISRIPLPILNSIEWWIGRSVCFKVSPDCELKSDKSLWLRPHFTACPFRKVCFAYNCDNSLLSIHEPFYEGVLY